MPRVAKKAVGKTVNPITTVSSVPDSSIADRYIHRKLGSKEDFDIFDVAYEHAINVLIEGPTGSAKTMAVMAWAAQNKKRFYAIPSNVSIDPSQLFGKYAPPSEDNGGKWTWVDGGVTDIVRNGGALLINEVNFIPDRVSTVIFSFLDHRREITLLDHNAEVVRAHRPSCWCDLDAEECRSKWVLVLGDMNPGYAGTRELNAAFRNRFGIQLTWDYDPKVEIQLVTSSELLKLAKGMRAEHAAGKIEGPTSTNMLEEFELMVKLLGLDFAIDNFVNHHAQEDRKSIRDSFRTARANLEADYAPKSPSPPPVTDDELRDAIGGNPWTPSPGDDLSALDTYDWVRKLEEVS